MREIYRIVMPGGFVVLTIDLFLNVAPFTNRERNSYGSNIDVKWLTQLAPFELIAGEKRELYGFPEFSASAILARLEEFLVGKYPAMAQMLCLRKPLAAK